ncbi:voltage-dependent T-type calcium channel subunit alpha-1I-like protein [Lates japonicus]|uniref:Voltage-dependent T-type calcium channel subunit alpha-1I-like protein n=1 Tax=Lates japonicus TaxID=270547 RepID=A0AAD3N129_LATJO|nr:voltage-dependent T-type calcium channel subunit alpha-1I-like protein [Lates japonicus]
MSEEESFLTFGGVFISLGSVNSAKGSTLSIFLAFDAFIYIFFALEMVVKMVALGIFGRRCYLGDTWNRLDFFIVMAG